MTLRIPRPPHAVAAALQRGIGAFLQPSPTASFTMSGAASIDVDRAHEVFNVDLEDVAEGRLLSAAYSTGWRYLLQEPNGTRAAVEVSADRDARNEYVVTHVNQGPFVASTVRGLEILERLGTQDGDLRLLRAPAIYLVCLWVHGRFADSLMPLPPAPREVNPFELTSSRQLIDVAQRLAVRAVELHSQLDLRDDQTEGTTEGSAN